jgi:hypothetical protein
MMRSWLRSVRWAACFAVGASSLLCATNSSAASNPWIYAYTSYPSSTCVYDSGGHFVYAWATAYVSPFTFLGPPTSVNALPYLVCNVAGATGYAAASYCNTSNPTTIGVDYVMLGYFQNDSSGYPFHADSTSAGGTAYPATASTTVPGYPKGGSSAGASCGTITGYAWGAINPTP